MWSSSLRVGAKTLCLRIRFGAEKLCFIFFVLYKAFMYIYVYIYKIYIHMYIYFCIYSLRFILELNFVQKTTTAAFRNQQAGRTKPRLLNGHWLLRNRIKEKNN